MTQLDAECSCRPTKKAKNCRRCLWTSVWCTF